MSKRGGGGGGGRSKVACAKPADPPFIQKIKEKIGWKAEPTIESKREQLPDNDSDPEFDEPDEEKPTVVVLKAGDLNAEEADEAQKEADLNDRTPGRYKYRKPTGKSGESAIKLSSVKRSSSADREEDAKRKQGSEAAEEKEIKNRPATATRNLLSFGDDEDED